MSDQKQAPELTITDLQNVRSVIDIAATRGAFKAAEMAAVGSVFNKLDAFLQAVVPAQTNAEQPKEGQPEQG